MEFHVRAARSVISHRVLRVRCHEAPMFIMPPNRPVLNPGRCLWTCSSQKQYFNQSTSSCQSCDLSRAVLVLVLINVDSSILRNGTLGNIAIASL